MNTIEKRIQLPSNGYFGGPKEVTIRAMTTKEEKIILSARDFSVFTQLVRSCIVDPEDIDVGLLHQNDIMYLVYALRELTFGNTYTQEVICPECGFKQETEIDINEMNVTYLDSEGLEDTLLVKLPVNGDELQLKLLSSGDNNRLDKQVKNRTAKGKVQDPETYEFTIKLMETIVSKNGGDFESFEDKRNYVDTLNMKDLVAIQNTLNKIEFGLDPSVVITCNKCKEEVEVSGLICPEFFRPTK